MKLKYRIVKKTYPDGDARYFPQWSHWVLFNLIWFNFTFGGVTTYERALEVVKEELNSHSTSSIVVSHHG